MCLSTKVPTLQGKPQYLSVSVLVLLRTVLVYCDCNITPYTPCEAAPLAPAPCPCCSWKSTRHTFYANNHVRYPTHLEGSYWSILWFPIQPLPYKTFWKFSDFHSENGLKSILTIIVMGNKQWFTSFCFQSWFPENEMLPDKTFLQRIQIYIICEWSTALWWCILMFTGLYWTIFNHKSRIRW